MGTGGLIRAESVVAWRGTAGVCTYLVGFDPFELAAVWRGHHFGNVEMWSVAEKEGGRKGVSSEYRQERYDVSEQGGGTAV
jgi:hypothetical protein